MILLPDLFLLKAELYFSCDGKARHHVFFDMVHKMLTEIFLTSCRQKISRNSLQTKNCLPTWVVSKHEIILIVDNISKPRWTVYNCKWFRWIFSGIQLFSNRLKCCLKKMRSRNVWFGYLLKMQGENTFF